MTSAMRELMRRAMHMLRRLQFDDDLAEEMVFPFINAIAFQRGAVRSRQRARVARRLPLSH